MSRGLNIANFPVDITEIVFAEKNRDYGAYFLRRLYPTNLFKATWTTVIFFSIAVSSPIWSRYILPAKKQEAKKVISIDYTQLSQPPSIDKTQPPPNVVAPPPLKSTIKFLPPVVKPDAQVHDEYVPTQTELKTVEPGVKTQQGDVNGVDYSLLDVQDKVAETPVKKEEVFTYAEEMPNFPGGDEKLLDYFSTHIVYPDLARRAGVEGKLFVSFVIRSNGSVTDVQVIKGLGAGLDEEAVRVVNSMPTWNPGRQNGKPVNVKVTIPIIFKLQQ
jgi:periplasmic protein TonB